MTVPAQPQHVYEYCTCPLCGMNRKLYKTGADAARRAEAGQELRKPMGSKAPGQVAFDAMRLSTALIMQLRDVSGGRNGGLKVVGGWTLKQMAGVEQYKPLVEQIRQQCSAILKILSPEGKVKGRPLAGTPTLPIAPPRPRPRQPTKPTTDIEGLQSELSGLMDADRKAASIARLEKALERLDHDKYSGLDDIESAIADYREAERDEKESAFDDIVSAVDGIELVEEGG